MKKKKKNSKLTNAWVFTALKPLSANEAFAPRSVKRGRFHRGEIYKTPKYQEYERILKVRLPDLSIPEDKITLRVKVCYLRSNSDIDNCLKPFIDVLQKRYGFNDNKIYKIIIKKEVVKKGNEGIWFQLLPYGHKENTMAIRTRKETARIVVHTVDVEKHSDNDKMLWELEVKSREKGVDGHGVHYIVMPDGVLVNPLHPEVYGNVTPQLNANSVFVRVPQLNGDTTDEQEAALVELLESLESKFSLVGFTPKEGW